MNEPTGRTTPLVDLLHQMVGPGLRGPGDIIAHAPDLIGIITPHSRDPLTGATATYDVIRTAIDTLDEPARSAVLALYGLDPPPPGRRKALDNATTRRTKAGKAIDRSGERFRRAYETIYITDLAAEIRRHLHTGDTTRPDPRVHRWPLTPTGPQTPPPPATSFRPARLLPPDTNTGRAPGRPA